MKILFLHPQASAEHPAAKALQTTGAGVLFATTADDAWQMMKLQGATLDLIVVHREAPGSLQGAETPALSFLGKVKSAAQYADIPFILTSDTWGDADFAKHQRTPHGANAYLKAPFTDAQLLSLLGQVLGTAPANKPAPAPPKAGPPGRPAAAVKPAAPASAGGTSTQLGELVLEDATNYFLKSDPYEASDTSIRLEAPDATGAGTAAIPPPPELPLQAAPDAPSQIQIGAGLDIPAAAPELPADLPGAVDAPVFESGTFALSAVPGAATPDSLEQMLDAAPGAAAAGGGGIELPTAAPEQEPQFGGIELPDVGPDDGAAAVYASASEEPQAADQEAEKELPYLFRKSARREPEALPAGVMFAQPVGDAVIPGGVAQAPDVETLKKYLLLREQDVGVLSQQFKAAREQNAALEDTIKSERARTSELSFEVGELQKRIDEFEREKQASLEGAQGEIRELKFQMKSRSDKARLLEIQVKEMVQEMEMLRERVRVDIRKIRVREKELENKLEISRKDAEALISAREGRIIELKRKLDLLEFNMDLLQDQYSKEKELNKALQDRLGRIGQVMRVAGGILDVNAGETVAADEDGDKRAS